MINKTDANNFLLTSSQFPIVFKSSINEVFEPNHINTCFIVVNNKINNKSDNKKPKSKVLEFFSRIK